MALKAYDKEHFYYNDLLIDLVALYNWWNFNKQGASGAKIHNFSMDYSFLRGVAKDLITSGYWSQRLVRAEQYVKRTLEDLKKLGYNIID